MQAGAPGGHAPESLRKKDNCKAEVKPKLLIPGVRQRAETTQKNLIKRTGYFQVGGQPPWLEDTSKFFLGCGSTPPDYKAASLARPSFFREH